MSWINKIFGTNKVEEIPTRKIDYIQITKDWNADPVSPEIELKVDEIDLIMDIYLNHFQFDKYQEGDKVKIRFKNCAEYSLNTCNDEGFYHGQYRIKPSKLEWGEFYEIKSGLDRKLPNPIKIIQNDNSDRKHFIFFFKDKTFECLASDYYLDFYNEKVLKNCKTYKVVLGDKEIGTSKLEKADAPMGVAFGLIEFNGIETPYEFFKEYCLKNNIVLNNDDRKLEFIDTQVILELKVFRQDGLEIKGVAGNAIMGMKDKGYEISILGISYPFYEEEFPHHVEHYGNMFKKE
ncbi:hypothetical protein [Flavobacterium soli]|uniref:hypothetical protein n=1 Tax=Flavobacterium soli TaxID=344881 RepID=UPI00040C5258|nr:hypothetical protein [Flavobacterium soli]